MSSPLIPTILILRLGNPLPFPHIFFLSVSQPLYLPFGRFSSVVFVEDQAGDNWDLLSQASEMSFIDVTGADEGPASFPSSAPQVSFSAALKQNMTLQQRQAAGHVRTAQLPPGFMNPSLSQRTSATTKGDGEGDERDPHLIPDEKEIGRLHGRDTVSCSVCPWLFCFVKS